MRPIEFRGKRIDNGEWVEGHYVYMFDHSYHSQSHDDVPERHHYIQGYAEFYTVHPETVGQFTGLTINDRKVFEGDLYQYRDGSDSCHFEVTWDNDRLAWNYKRIEDGELMYTHYDYGLLEDSIYTGTIHDKGE